MPNHPYLRYLHLSDLHFRNGSPAQLNDQKAVNDSLLKAIAELPADEPLDFICITGDIAFSGQREEYELALAFCNRLLEITKVPKERLYLTPGNHDLDRRQVSRTLERMYSRFADQTEISEYLGDTTQRPLMMAKFAEFNRFAGQVMGRTHYDDRIWHLTECLKLDKDGQLLRVNLLCLNSALLAGYDGDDQQRLALGNYQVDPALGQLDEDAPLSIGLFHHPFACHHKADTPVQNRLRHALDLILTGHLHEGANAVEQTGAGRATLITAGAAYETRTSRNSFNRVTIDLTTGQGEVKLWKFVSGHTCWVRDTETNPHNDGLFTFDIPAIKANPLTPVAAPTPPNLPRVSEPAGGSGTPPPRTQVRFVHDYLLPADFTGRVAEQAQLTALLGLDPSAEAARPAAVVAIQALGGMGKSALARRMVENIHLQPGGPFRRVVWYSFYESRSDDEAAAFRDLLDALAFETPPTPEGQAAAEPLRKHLCRRLDALPCLLVLDGLEVIQHSRDPQRPDFGRLKESHRQTGQLLRHLCNQGQSRALITTRISLADLRGATGFDELPLHTFSDAEAADLWQRIRVQGTRGELEQAVRPFAGHPLALRAAGHYLQERAIPAREVEQLIGDPVLFRASSEGERVKRIVDAHRAHLSEAQQHFLKMLAIHPRAVGLVQHTALLHPKVRGRRWWPGWSEYRIQEELILPLFRYGLIERLDGSGAGGEHHYSAHPLMKLAFGSWLDPEGNRRAHADWAEAAKGSPVLASSTDQACSLEQLQPSLDVVEHYLEAGAFERAWEMWRDREVDNRLAELGYSRLLLKLGKRFEKGMDGGTWHPSALKRSFLYQYLGHAYHGLDRQREALEYGEKQYATVREMRDVAIVVANGAILAQSHAGLGHLARARGLLAELRHQAEQLAEGEEKAIYRAVEAEIALYSGDYGVAQSLYEAALKHGSPHNLIAYRFNLGEVQLRNGQWDAADASLRQTLEESELAPIPDLLPEILQRLCWLALKRQDPATARRLIDRRIALLKGMGRPHEDNALLLVQEGRHHEALALAAQHLTDPDGGEPLDKDAEIKALLVTAQARHGLGEGKAARAALDLARVRMEETGCWRCKDWLAETEALLAAPNT